MVEANFSIETPRLILRDFRFSDVAALMEITAEPGFFFVGIKPGEHGAIEFINKALNPELMHSADGKRASFRLAVTLKDTGKLIGYIGGWIFNPDPQLRKYGFEIGYFISTPERNKGYASEATQGLIDVLYRDHGVKHFCATTELANPASARILEKNGFVLEIGFDTEFLEHYYGAPRQLFKRAL